MGKMLGVVMSLIGAVCVATVFSAVVLAYYYRQAWHVTNTRMSQAVAIMQGKPPESFVEKAPKLLKADPEKDQEQTSFSEMQEAWALKTRDLELREQMLRSEISRMQRERLAVKDDKKKIEQLYNKFAKDIDDVDKGEKAKGRDEVRAILETAKPKQSKELLAQMFEKKEMDDVVMILSTMPEGKRAKIIAEFKTPSEVEQIGDVLRQIRNGLPKTAISDAAQKKLQSPSGTGL